MLSAHVTQGPRVLVPWYELLERDSEVPAGHPAKNKSGREAPKVTDSGSAGHGGPVGVFVWKIWWAGHREF